MKQTPRMDQIQEQMRPGIITLVGFLGNDDRNLIDILESDDATVKRLGYTHQSIARRMRELRNKAVDGLGNFVDIPPHFKVRVDTVRGKLPCPFGDPGIHQKAVTVVKNTELNKEVTYTDLNIHMIEAHGFYQGRDSLYRQNPEELVEVLEVKKPGLKTPLDE